MPIRPMKETSETHLLIKPKHLPKAVQNAKAPPTPTQASSPSPPSKNRSRRRNRGGRKSDQGDVCMRPSSRPRKPPPQNAAPVAAVSGTEIVAVNHQMQMGVRGSSKNSNFAPRPGFGQLGTKCIVKANHFLADLPTKDLSHYDVTITPEVSSKSVNRAIIAELVRLYKESELGSRLPAYDGRKSLYTAGELPFTWKEFAVKIFDEDDGIINGPRRERSYKVAIKFVARANMHHLGEFLAGKRADGPQEALQILDIVLRELSVKRFCPVGRSFFSPDIRTPQRLGEGLQSWCGFYQSIRPTQMGLSLNIDMASAAFIEPLPVIEFVAQLLGKDVLSKPLSDSDRIKIKKGLRGVKVEVTHRANVRRKYRVAGLTTQPTRELMFPVDENATMKSVIEYFQEMYGFTIQHTHLPCLQVGNQKKASYLPMEACKIVEGQRYTKRLNEKQITALLKVTCQRPRDRENDILKTVQHNAYDQDPYAKEFGMNISEKLASVEARILPAPWLKYHENGKEKDCLPQVGQWNMMNKKMINGMTVSRWACVNFSRSVQENVARGFCNELGQMCEVSGMEFNPEPVIPIYSARPDQVEKALKHVYHTAMNKTKGKELELLLAILPDNNGSLYGDLKRICETELGLISQCCLTKHVFKISKQYLANVSLKINVKMGGRNTVLLDAISCRIPLVSDIPTIIFGADVTHPENGEESSPSIAAVVASQDWPEVTKYAGLVCAQAHRQELIQDLYKTWQDPVRGTVSGGMIRDLLISFRKATGQKPLRIIFYRDGVSEGQFYQVLLYELDAIRKACASLEPNYQPPVTFIVVQKRHHTRLFANNHRDKSSTDRSGNILPGTVVDTKICHPTEFDFYLCSHAGIQGTSRPAHYHVLWDENNFTADGIQSLTNNLCYTYARCTRSVSVVPPAYYAHLAAFRARFYMEPEIMQDNGSPGKKNTKTTTVGDHGVVGGGVKPLPALKENVKRGNKVKRKKKQIMALSSSCSTLKAVNSRWTSPAPKLAAIRRHSLLPELRYTPNVKLTATNALRTVEQTTLTEDDHLSTYGSDQDDQESLPKPRILVAEKLGEAGVNLLKDFGDVDCSYELSPEDLKKKVAESDALIVRSGTKVTREVFEAAKGRLKVVGRAGVGIDNADLQAATEYGCLVVNAPTANTVAAAEHGIALLASMARNVAQADASIKAGKWERSKYVGVSLVGKTLAIMGFGKVGTEVARRAKGLGMNVISHDPYAPADRARALGVELVSFDQAISTADFISLHMPLTPATKKVFNDETFSKMKKGVRLINVARGGVIDEDALVRALDSGVVAQAALDVFCEEPPSKESRLIQHENVTVTPHLGASTKEAQEGVAIEIAEAVAGALRGELSATAVNAPMVAPEVLSELAPYIVLAEKLGRLAVQLASGGKGVQSIKVVYRSARDRDDLDTRLLRAMITKGIIEPISDSYVNLVNADFIAKQKGLRISEERTVVESSPEYPVDSIQVQISNVESSFAGAVSDGGAISIEGKVKYGVPHLTCVGSFGVDVSLEGNLILCRQVDQPGMIGQVGNILGEQNVNVSFMSVGRTVVRKQAIMAIGVDEEPDKKTLERIGGVSAIEEFVFLKL